MEYQWKKWHWQKDLTGGIVCCTMLYACNSVFDIHPYDVRVQGETDVNAKNIQKIEQTTKDKCRWAQ